MFTDYFKIIRQALSESREHYRVHKLLAEAFRTHPVYGEKMLWAFHRMTYSGEAELSEEEYAIARKALMKLWKRNKKQDWKLHMSEKMKGNKNGIGGKDNWIPTEEQRKRYADAAIKRQTGKVGEESRASKGIVVCENKITGEKIEAGSALQLATKLNMNCSVFHEVLNGSKYGSNPKPKSTRSKYYQFLQDHKIYYK